MFADRFTHMGTANHATTTLFILTALQWMSVVTLSLATINSVRNRFPKKLGPIALWFVTPLAMIISTTSYKQNHLKELLQQQITQTWSWQEQHKKHILHIDAFKNLYSYRVENQPKSTRKTKEIKYPASANWTGHTSKFKSEWDVNTHESYYSLYLFDFPRTNFISMLEIQGLSSPKIHLGDQQIIELTREPADMQ